MHFSPARDLALVALTGSSLLAPVLAAAPAKDYLSHAEAAAQLLLDKYYNHDTGLLADFWWNTGAALTELADLQAYAPGTTNPKISDVLSNTFDKANDANSTEAGEEGNFINGFYDDEGWWALTWIASYDLTKDAKYLQKAEYIFENMKTGLATDTKCGNAIWWDKAKTGINAIENELFISVAAHLANRVPEKLNYYAQWAEKTWDWFATSGMVNLTGNIVQDAYDYKTCKGKSAQLSYTQGVIIGGLLELHRVCNKTYFLTNATAIADATISVPRFNDEQHIFTEPVGGFENNTMQFKGIFMRNLRLLQRHVPKQSYVDFATRNADSVWANRWTQGKFAGQFGPVWDKKDIGTEPYMPSQISGTSALLAAGAMEMPQDTPDVVTKRSFSRFWSRRA